MIRKERLHMFKKCIAAGLALLQIFMLASCKKPTSNEKPKEEAPVPTLKLVENGRSDFTIVIPDKTTGDVIYAAEYLSEVSAQFCEEKLAVVKSSEMGDNEQNTIILKKTKLDGGPNTYLIKAEEGVIRLYGNSELAIKTAVMKFINAYLKTPSDTVSVPLDLNEQKRCENLFIYTLSGSGMDLYDRTLAAVCAQGLFNRDGEDLVYIVDEKFAQTSEYLNLLTTGSRWLGMKIRQSAGDLASLLRLASDDIKSVVIWDEAVPASVNVATTIAGVKDGIVMTKNLYRQYMADLPSDVEVIDLNKKFDGSVTGSKKNDAYKYAIDNYLAKGLCSTENLFSYEDSAIAREKGDLSYVVCRDYAIQHRGFVYDLSPWADEVPKDDKKQKLGLDRTTLLEIYSTVKDVRGEGLTQLYGFFPFWKYSNNGNDAGFTSKYVPTHCEWEYAYLFTPFDIFWNPVVEDAYNMTVHSKYEIKTPLVQNEPRQAELDNDPNKVYLLMVMGDYDSSGTFYKRFLNDYETKGRVDLPKAWSINPNVLETYPDLIEYVYENRCENDYFVSNVGGAGWYNPSRVSESSWKTVVAHHQKFFKMADMSICPDIWDVEPLSEISQNAIAQYAPDGMGILVAGMNGHGNGKKQEQTLTQTGTPVDALANSFVRDNVKDCAQSVLNEIRERKNSDGATFISFRVVWVNTEYVMQCLDELKKNVAAKGYGWDVEAVDPYVYYSLLEKSLAK